MTCFLIYRKRLDRIQHEQTPGKLECAIERASCSIHRTAHVSDQHLESYRVLEQWIETAVGATLSEEAPRKLCAVLGSTLREHSSWGWLHPLRTISSPSLIII
jgi:hypothetical protein